MTSEAADAKLASLRSFQPGDCRRHCRPSVQAAAEKTSTFAAITGTAPIKKPYTIHRVAPPICTARNGAGREKK